MGLRLEWDRRKAALNLRKHRVTFDEASTVFRDPLASIFDNENCSEREVREIIIGHSILGRLLIVCFTERANGVIRIVSARVATKNEKRDYEERKSV
jgi:uncharacterized DUF497 family protein